MVETGAEVTSLVVGDRVRMESRVPDLASRAALLGLYNVDRRILAHGPKRHVQVLAY